MAAEAAHSCSTCHRSSPTVQFSVKGEGLYSTCDGCRARKCRSVSTGLEMDVMDLTQNVSNCEKKIEGLDIRLSKVEAKVVSTDLFEPLVDLGGADYAVLRQIHTTLAHHHSHTNH